MDSNRAGDIVAVCPTMPAFPGWGGPGSSGAASTGKIMSWGSVTDRAGRISNGHGPVAAVLRAKAWWAAKIGLASATWNVARRLRDMTV
jgi:hypothetical protein